MIASDLIDSGLIDSDLIDLGLAVSDLAGARHARFA
jgi:hypothetical protein